MLSIRWRLAIASVIGLITLGIGLLLRKQQAMTALILQGVGLGIVYLTVFGAFQFYDLFGMATAFAILVVVAIAGVVLSTWQNAKYLALFSFLGGFIAPLLLQSNTPDVTALFSYYLVLNVGIFIIAWFRQWRELNYLGFIATFAATGLWSYQAYAVSYFAVTQTFLILFFLLYLLVAIVFSYKKTQGAKKIIDTTLTFALPLIFFLYQAKLLHYEALHMAIASFALAALYGVIAMILHLIKTQNRPILFAMLACAIIFFTAAIPLALQNHWTGITWALEGAALFWYGRWQQRRWPCFAGVLLQLAAFILFIYYFPPQVHVWYLLNGTFLGALVLIMSAFFSAYVAKEHPDLRLSFFILGLLWFIFIGVYENWVYFHHHVIPQQLVWLLGHHEYWQAVFAGLLYFSACGFVAAVVNRFIKFNLLQVLVYIAVSLLLINEVINGVMPNTFMYYLFAPYLIAILFCYGSLYFLKNYLSTVSGVWLTALLWCATLVQIGLCVARFNHTVIPNQMDSHYATMGIAIALYYFVFECGNVLRVFPFCYQSQVYARYTPLALCGVFLLWFFASTLNTTGSMLPLIYLPLLNPVDLSTGLILFSIYHWRKTQRQWLAQRLPNNLKITLLCLFAVGFMWANAILLRTLHHWADLPLSVSAIMNSATAQISLSILWAVIALTFTIGGSVKHKRLPWMAGASLIGVLVIKVLLVDLSNQNTIARIISFISVGILLLFIGYFTPLPPKKLSQLDS